MKKLNLSMRFLSKSIKLLVCVAFLCQTSHVAMASSFEASNSPARKKQNLTIKRKVSLRSVVFAYSYLTGEDKSRNENILKFLSSKNLPLDEVVEVTVTEKSISAQNEVLQINSENETLSYKGRELKFSKGKTFEESFMEIYQQMSKSEIAADRNRLSNFAGLFFPQAQAEENYSRGAPKEILFGIGGTIVALLGAAIRHASEYQLRELGQFLNGKYDAGRGRFYLPMDAEDLNKVKSLLRGIGLGKILIAAGITVVVGSAGLFFLRGDNASAATLDTGLKRPTKKDPSTAAPATRLNANPAKTGH